MAADVETYLHSFFEVEEWQTRAKCIGESTDIFFPEQGRPAHQARLVCGRCPVREECLNYALDKNIYYGVWGGLSDKERQKLKRRRRLAA